jgi:hypothetical protein
MNDAGNVSVINTFKNKKSTSNSEVDYSYFHEVPIENEIDCPIKLAHCPRCDGLYFFNIHTGEHINGKCKAYSCDYCGPKKAYRLECALTEYFKQYSHLRLFTFTFRTSALDKCPDANKASSEIWRRFIIDIRRSTSLSPFQRNVDYVRVLEFTRRGYPHFHVFMSEYMPIQVIQGIFNNAVNKVCGTKGTNCHIEVTYSGCSDARKNKGNFTPERAAKYCAKYVLKSAKEKPENMRLWSKSSNVKLFPDKAFSCGWFFLNLRSSFLNLYELGITSQPPLPGEVNKLSFIEIVATQFPELHSILHKSDRKLSDYTYQNL